MTAIPLTGATPSNRLYLTVLHVGALALIQYVYTTFISDIYLSEGFQNEFNVLKFYTSVATLIIFSLAIPRTRRLVSFQLHATLSIAIIPMFVIYAGMDLPNWFYSIAAVSFIVTLCTSQIYVPAFSIGSINPKNMMRLLIILSILFIFSFYLLGSFVTINFDLNRVYELRREIALSLPPIYGYLIPLFSKSFIPIAIVIAASLKRYDYAAILSVISIILFGLTTHKGILFYPFVTLFVYIVFRKFRAERAFLKAIIAVSLISIVDFVIYMEGTGDAWIGSLLIRRALILPALHNYYYIEFFSENPWYWWSHSKLALGLVPMPYETTAPFIIGIEYYDNEATSANTGWIGSGYANAGMFGVIVYAALTGLLFSLIETFGKKFGPALVMGIFITPIIDIFTSADLTTLVLTHGLLTSILILMVTGPHTHNRQIAAAARSTA